MERAVYLVAGFFAALALTTGASGAGSSTPGVTSTQIVIGGTIPLSGVASAYQTVGKGAAAYFRYVNAHGGVFHRKITYLIKDDQYDSSQTVNKTRELVEQDHVFAIFNSLGTEQNLATRPYLNAMGVPQLFVASDSDVQSQVAKLKTAHANTMMLFATPQFAIQAYVYARKLGWRPKVYVNAVASASNIMGIASNATNKKQTEGSISIVFLKDPTDPRWAKDPGIKLYRTIMKKYKGVHTNDVYNVYGMSVAHSFVEALKKAGKNPTRMSIMKAVTHLNVHNDPFLLPGIVARTTSTDHFPLDQARLERLHNGRWVSFGGLFRVR